MKLPANQLRLHIRWASPAATQPAPPPARASTGPWGTIILHSRQPWTNINRSQRCYVESLDYTHTMAKSLPKPPAEPHVRSHGVTSREAPWRSASLHHHGSPASSCHILFTGITTLHPSHLLTCRWGIWAREVATSTHGRQQPWRCRRPAGPHPGLYTCCLQGQNGKYRQRIERSLTASANIRLPSATRLRGNTPLSREMEEN